jgi:uncharacterized repeat protein (TIGR04052 family)
MSNMLRRFASLATIPFLASLAACSDSSSTTAPDTSPRPVAIKFAARVGDLPATCTQSYAALGTTRSTASITEFMALVSDVSLLRADGTAVPVTLTPDAKWQLENITLLDFAAGGAGTNCPNASPETNLQVVGTVPGGATYTGLRFTLGLPFARNHGDATTAPGPLAATAMFWSWNGGYKAMRLDVKSTGTPTGWFVHLGSTGCSPTGSATTVPTACTARNVMTYTFSNFDAAKQTVVADVATFLASSNLDVNQGGPAGCMSGTTDGDCAPIFTSFGLPFNGSATPSTQSLFRIITN